MLPTYPGRVVLVPARRALALLGALLVAALTVALTFVGTATAGAQTHTSSAVSSLEPALSTAEPRGSTILIGTGGLIWSDVTETATPNLWGMLRDGSTAALMVRSVNTSTCDDGTPTRATARTGAASAAAPRDALRDNG